MRYLGECLDSLSKQSFRAFDTILVDNGSVDGSVDFVRLNYPEVRIVSLTENVGFAAANNIVLRTVEAEYMALLNNDAVADPHWLESLLLGLEAHPEAGFAASKMLSYDHPNEIDRAGDAYTWGGTGLLRGRGLRAHRLDAQEWVFGACAGAALYRTSMLREIGFFDEDFFLLYEDVDLSFRAQLTGYRCLYVPGAIVRHKGSGSIIHDSATSVYYSHRNLEWVYVKNMPSGLICKTICFHLIYDMASFLFFMATGKGKEFLKAKLDALRGFKKALRKRRKIQSKKKVSDKYLWRVFEKEWLLPRLTRRLAK
jgi:GT2 family glycosyltransferase